MKKWINAAAALLTAAMIAGCGSSSMMPGSNVTVSGKVADGYLQNATVFLDRNGNYQLDAGEPSATTDANGSFSLAVAQNDLGRCPLIALAQENVTIDRDNPGVRLGSSYMLSFPRQSVNVAPGGNFISPLSTQIREMMETGNYEGIQQAMEALRVSLGLPVGTSMMADYIAGQNAGMHAAAQNMAGLMGGQAPLVFRNFSGAMHLDVNRYRGMMGTMFSNMSSVRVAATGSTMEQLMSSMTTTVSNIASGTPFQNMSSFFRGGMGGNVTMVGPMMGR